MIQEIFNYIDLIRVLELVRYNKDIKNKLEVSKKIMKKFLIKFKLKYIQKIIQNLKQMNKIFSLTFQEVKIIIIYFLMIMMKKQIEIIFKKENK